MVDFFTDEIKTYLVGNNDPIACTTSHHILSKKIRDRLELFKKLKKAVEELAIEIPNHAEMYTFVVLKKDINSFDKLLTDKSSVLKALDEGKGTIQPGLRLVPSGNFFLALNRSHQFLLKKVRI